MSYGNDASFEYVALQFDCAVISGDFNISVDKRRTKGPTKCVVPRSMSL